MKLGYIVATGTGDPDCSLAVLAAGLEARGHRLAGTVQSNVEDAQGGRCDMDLRILGTTSEIRISQSLGPGARGCRLDTAALEAAVAAVGPLLEKSVDLVIINKFGKHEAEGRGFRSVIADALERGLPVVTSVNALNHGPFLKFAGELAEELQADAETLENWFRDDVSDSAA